MEDLNSHPMFRLAVALALPSIYMTVYEMWLEADGIFPIAIKFENGTLIWRDGIINGGSK